MAVDPSAIAAAFLKTYQDMMATGSAETVANLYVRCAFVVHARICVADGAELSWCVRDRQLLRCLPAMALVRAG